MVTKEELTGQWNEVKGRLKEHWGQLTEDDLMQARGSTDQLVGVVQQKTGATRSEVENFLSDMFGDSSKITDRATEAAQHYADAASEFAAEAGDYVKENYRRVAGASSEYTDKIAHTVKARPAESIAIAFGLGIAAGAILFFKGRR